MSELATLIDIVPLCPVAAVPWWHGLAWGFAIFNGATAVAAYLFGWWWRGRVEK